MHVMTNWKLQHKCTQLQIIQQREQNPFNDIGGGISGKWQPNQAGRKSYEHNLVNGQQM